MVHIQTPGYKWPIVPTYRELFSFEANGESWLSDGAICLKEKYIDPDDFRVKAIPEPEAVGILLGQYETAKKEVMVSPTIVGRNVAWRLLWVDKEPLFIQEQYATALLDPDDTDFSAWVREPYTNDNKNPIYLFDDGGDFAGVLMPLKNERTFELLNMGFWQETKQLLEICQAASARQEVHNNG